jgi:Phage integrase family
VEQRGRADERRLGLCQSHHGEALFPDRDSKATHPACRMVSGAVPAVWCRGYVWCSQGKPTPNGARLPIHKERRASASKYSSIGWHTFRHTYRSWLDETGAPLKVQQELMRHASIQTTMNVYGQAMSSSRIEANGKVVEMVLKPMKASA